MANFSGNYLCFVLESDGTTWGPGPVVTINTAAQTILIDGVQMKNPTFTSSSIIWLFSSGNESSGSLILYVASSGNNAIIGKYAIGTDTLPSANNFSGSASSAPDDLSVWNATFNTFIKQGSKWEQDSKLTVNSPNVAYKQVDISNYVYQGTKGTSNLESLQFFSLCLLWCPNILMPNSTCLFFR